MKPARRLPGDYQRAWIVRKLELDRALWAGACTVAATLLTNFRGFAGVSAGFMTALVGLDAYNASDKVFDIAMARAAATINGIACSLLVTTIFAPHRAQALMMKSLRQAISDTARRVAFPLGGSAGRPFCLRAAIGRHPGQARDPN